MIIELGFEPVAISYRRILNGAIYLDRLLISINVMIHELKMIIGVCTIRFYLLLFN
jgi:hypothetical protein